MQQSCQNFIGSSHLPDKGKSILSFTSLEEVVGAAAVEGAILFSLGGSRFNWAKRSRRELGSSGLGSKSKESNKGLVSSIVLVQVIHWGFPQCSFVHSGS